MTTTSETNPVIFPNYLSFFQLDSSEIMTHLFLFLNLEVYVQNFQLIYFDIMIFNLSRHFSHSNLFTKLPY